MTQLRLIAPRISTKNPFFWIGWRELARKSPKCCDAQHRPVSYRGCRSGRHRRDQCGPGATTRLCGRHVFLLARVVDHREGSDERHRVTRNCFRPTTLSVAASRSGLVVVGSLALSLRSEQATGRACSELPAAPALPCHSNCTAAQPLGCMRLSVGMSLLTPTSGVRSLHIARAALRPPPASP